jgi:predicted metalloprotease with PDZ domain
MRISYSVSVERPTDHRADFVLDIEGVGGPSLDIVLPSWVPGSYKIRDPARNVRALRASAMPSEAPLDVQRVDKARWRVAVGAEPSVRVRYTVYGHALITEGLDVTAEHLFLNAGLCLPYVDGHKDAPYELALHVPAGWTVVTELKEVERHPPTYRAESYDELVDSPVDCGTPVVLTITPKGIPHRLVLCGVGGNYEVHRLETDVGKIVEATAKLFGGLPMPRYTFFYHLTDRRDGGLEHRTSTSIVVPRTMFRPESDYQKFLDISSHEYFHLFNVKRIRPKVLGPFDYTKENYTRLLWVMEGTTDYYTPLLVRRAGLRSPSKYLEGVAEAIRRYLEVPGRLVRSLEEASLTSWIDLYQPYEETVNQSVSYYLKGGLVSMCLDLEIRHRTENRSSLDAVMRHLWTGYGAQEKGIGEEEMRPIAEKVTGLDLGDFFRKYVAGTDEVDFAAFARHAGLSFGPKEKPPEPGDDAEAGYLGVDIENAMGLTRLRTVREGSPARRAGLSPGDEVVALDGAKVTFDDFAKALKRFPAGSSVDVALFRRGWLLHVPVTTGKGLAEKFQFEMVSDPTPLEQQIYQSWLEAKWEPPKKDGAAAGRATAVPSA